jgi:acetyl-CoA carboxylase biotin carboxylase subunit
MVERSPMMEKIAIVGSGDLAARVARSCEKLGIATLTLFDPAGLPPYYYSNPEQSVPIEGLRESTPAAIAAVIEAAKERGAQAIYPATPLFGARVALSQAASEAGLIFIGSAPDALVRMHDRVALRELARIAGVRTIPASEGPLPEDEQELFAIARTLGLPLRIKPALIDPSTDAAIATVEELADLPAALERSRAALSALPEGSPGRDTALFLEQEIDRPRVLLVPVLVDKFGDSLALPERESSVRRGDLVLIDESPAPALRGLPQSELKRQTLLDTAARIALESGAIGALCVEFLLDSDQRLYVHALRPGLFGAVGATEMSTGRDLAEAQIRLASGEHLLATYRDRPIAGHAIEARVRTEATPHNPALGPKPDAIRALRWPPVVPGAMRIEASLATGVVIAPEDELLIASVVTYGQTRHQAFLTLDRVLSETTIEPIVCNLRLLRDILGDESYRAGQYDTGFVDRLLKELRTPQVKEAS